MRLNTTSRAHSMLRRLSLPARTALDFLLPEKCALCGEVLPLFGKAELCTDCLKAYSERVTKTCAFCRADAGHCRCSKLRSQNLGSDAITLGFYESYDDEVGRLVYSFKRRYSRGLTRFFARSLAIQIRRRGFAADTVVTYPPRSRKALRKYGFDQSQFLAREVARYLGLEAYPALRRLRGSEQKKLDAKQRSENASGAFAHNPKYPVAGRSLILIDDVSTTGATLAEAAKVLRSAGAADVQFATLFLNAPKRIPAEHGLWFEDDGGTDEAYDLAAEDVGF